VELFQEWDLFKGKSPDVEGLGDRYLLCSVFKKYPHETGILTKRRFYPALQKEQARYPALNVRFTIDGFTKVTDKDAAIYQTTG
jgi:hypothetical protein